MMYRSSNREFLKTEKERVRKMARFEKDEYVYLRCKITSVPKENQRMYRLSTVSDNAIVWAEEDELLKAEKYGSSGIVVGKKCP